MLVKSDNMGFSMNETIVQSGASLTMEYKTTLRDVIVFGTGGERDHATGAVHQIKAVVFSVLDQHDNHTLLVDDEMNMFFIFIFNPALQGDEVYGEDGSYSA
jgi:hypothetical protein